MRHEAAVTSLSWIPSEAVSGLNKAIFGTGFTHYDPPPPDVIHDLDSLRDEDRFRFANALTAWVDVEGGRVVDAGYTGGGVMGSTTVAIGGKAATFAAVSLPDRQAPVAMSDGRGDVRADGRRPHGGAGTSSRQSPTVRAAASADGVDHAVVADPCRRSVGVRVDRSKSLPAALGLRRRWAGSPRRRGWPTSRTGGGIPSPATHHGVTRTRLRSSPPSKQHSSASSPVRS